MRLLGQGARKALLSVHVMTSVGWLGAVVAFLALALTTAGAADSRTAASLLIAMNVVARAVIVPLCFASLVTGTLSSLCTTWGLLRHYWVVVKLAMTVASTLLLLLHLPPIAYAARLAATAGAQAVPGALRPQITAEACVALLVLVTATVLSVYKPRGVTGLGGAAAP